MSCSRKMRFLTPGRTEYITDTTIQVGGPFKRDKFWFFTSFQYYRPKTHAGQLSARRRPPGYPITGIGPDARLEKSPRFLFKPTVKIGQSDQLTGFFEIDSYTVDGRNAGATTEGDITATEATLHQDSPEVAWNANFTKVLSSSSVFDVKYSGFWGYYYLSPYNGDDTPGWYDVDEQYYAVNSYYFYNADRVRHQANASLTKFASGFAGEHNLKFGAEFERSYVKSEWGYPGGIYVLAILRTMPVLRDPLGRIPQGQHQQPPHGVRAGFMDDRPAAYAQSRRTVRSDYRIQQAPRRAGVRDQFDLAAHWLRLGCHRATARRSSADTTAGTTTVPSRATTTC